MLDQQPVRPLATLTVVADPHQHEAALQPLSFKGKLEVALGESLLGRPVAFRLPVAAVPEHDRAAAILAFGNRAFEVTIVQRVVFHLHGQALVLGIERRSLGHSPGLEDAVEFEAQVIMEPRGVMFLDDKAPAV